MKKNIKKISMVIAILGIVGIISIAAMAAVPVTPSSKGGGGEKSKVSENGIYGMYDMTNHLLIDSSQSQQIGNYSFQLTEDSYVYVEGSGLFYNLVPGDESLYMIVDSNISNTVRRDYTCYPPTGGVCTIGFQLSRVYYLSSGLHTIQLFVHSSSYGMYQSAAEISISAIASQKGGVEIR